MMDEYHPYININNLNNIENNQPVDENKTDLANYPNKLDEYKFYLKADELEGVNGLFVTQEYEEMDSQLGSIQEEDV